MSSHSNRRIRAQRKRHARTVERLLDRLHTLDKQGRLVEAATVREQLFAIAPPKPASPKPVRKPLRTQEWVRAIGRPLGLSPTSPVLEKREPKRETRDRSKMGGKRW